MCQVILRIVILYHKLSRYALCDGLLPSCPAVRLALLYQSLAFVSLRTRLLPSKLVLYRSQFGRQLLFTNFRKPHVIKFIGTLNLRRLSLTCYLIT